MEGIVRDGMLCDVVLDVVLSPSDEGIDLDEVMVGVPLDGLDGGASGGLLLPEAGEPDLKWVKRPEERLDLADPTTSLAEVGGFVKGVDAVGADEVLNAVVLREKDMDLGVIMEVGAVDEGIGLREESSGVDGEDAGVLVELEDHVGKDLVFKG
jgi:hypothetical protein